MAEGLDVAEKAGEAWLEEHQVTGAAVPRREKSKEEKRLLLKMDLAIVPLLTLTFFMAYLVLLAHIPRGLRVDADTSSQGSKQYRQRTSNGDAERPKFDR